MQYRRLGNSGLKVSRIILGCMTYGNPSWEGSPWILDKEQSLPLLKKAFDMGINTFDTANTYSNGQSETILGRVLNKYSIPRALHDLVCMGEVRPLARGVLARPWQEKSPRADQVEKAKRWFVGDQNEIIANRVEDLARSKGCAMSSVAMAWLLREGACPIVGLNSITRIEAALEALDVELMLDEVRYLEEPYQPLAVQAI
ncbi:hypothetical protein N7486_003339 [Penicillium sp. IBT 16267x]|nr:hypothetical protein N7486_003339 [Penicillium sp. IBT 16267x]